MPPNRIAGLQLRGRTGTLQGRVCWPGSAQAGLARLLVYCVAGDVGDLCRELSAAAGLVVLSVGCGNGGLDDAMTAAEWAAEHSAGLGTDPGSLLIGGTGPGGALAAAVALRAWRDGWPPVRRQVLIRSSPVSAAPAWLTGLAPATVVTVEGDPGGDGGRYAAKLRAAGVPVDELRYVTPEPARLLAGLAQNLKENDA